jgi:TolA-binding protein
VDLVEPAGSASVARLPTGSLEPRVVAPHSSSAVSVQRPASSLGSFPLDPRETAASALAVETQRLEAARHALADGRATLALTTLTSYERDFPRGVLRPEALVLKVRALVAAGDRQAAEALGRRLIAQAPTSRHADAVRAALGRGTNP